MWPFIYRLRGQTKTKKGPNPFKINLKHENMAKTKNKAKKSY